MKLKIFKCLIILLFCFDAIDIYSQKMMIGNEVTNRPLTWDDFKGTPDANSPHYAVTYWGMIYQLNGIRTYGDSVHIDELMVELRMDTKKSWCKKEFVTDDLLKHEQGHFDIGKLCLKEFLTLYHNTTFHKKDMDATMKNIFYTTMHKYDELGVQYDRETDHSQQKEAQQHWNTFFAKYIEQ